MRGLGAVVTAMIVLVAGMVGTAPSALGADSPEVGEFHQTTPTRILDTRIGLGRAGALLPGQAIAIDPRTAAPGLGYANAYVLNVTVVGPTAYGNIELTPWSESVPVQSRSSAVNFVAGQTVANLATPRTDVRDMRLSVINRSGGFTHVVIDVLGYYAFGTADVSPGMLAPATTSSVGRVLDTRASGSVPAHGSITFPVTGVVDGRLGTSLANVTVVNARGEGHVTADPQNRTSVVNFNAGDTVANLSYLPISNGRTVTLYNDSSGAIDLVIDLAGDFYGDNTPRAAGVPLYPGRYGTLPTSRLVDTRFDLGAPGPLAYGASVRIAFPGLPATATAVVVNLTTTGASVGGSLVAFATGTPEPGTSNVNPAVGRAVANLAIVPVGADRTITVRSQVLGTVQLIVDVSGYYIGS